jgi:hypothetical protein
MKIFGQGEVRDKSTRVRICGARWNASVKRETWTFSVRVYPKVGSFAALTFDRAVIGQGYIGQSFQTTFPLFISFIARPHKAYTISCLLSL